MSHRPLRIIAATAAVSASLILTSLPAVSAQPISSAPGAGTSTVSSRILPSTAPTAVTSQVIPQSPTKPLVSVPFSTLMKKPSNKGKGWLRIVLVNTAGLPRIPVITIKGRGKTYRINKTKRIRVPAGVYTITTSPMTLSDGTLVSGYARSIQVTVKNKKTSSTEVDYGVRSSVPVVLLNADEVSSTPVQVAEAGDSQAFPGLPILSFTTTANVATGQFLQIPVGSPGFPAGFLGKVVRVAKNKNLQDKTARDTVQQIVVEYVSLVLVYANLDLGWRVPLGNITATVNQPIQTKAKPAGAVAGIGVVTECSKSVAQQLIDNVSVPEFGVGRSKAWILIRNGVLINASYDVTLTTEADLPNVVDSSCEFGVGIQSNTIIPLLALVGSLTVSAEANASYKGNLAGRVTIPMGFAYSNDLGVAGTVSSKAEIVGDANSVTMDTTMLGGNFSYLIAYPYQVIGIPEVGDINVGGGTKLGIVGTYKGGHLSAPSLLPNCIIDKGWDANIDFKIQLGKEIGVSIGIWGGNFYSEYTDVYMQNLEKWGEESKECALTGSVVPTTPTTPTSPPASTTDPATLPVMKNLMTTLPTRDALLSDAALYQAGIAGLPASHVGTGSYTPGPVGDACPSMFNGLSAFGDTLGNSGYARTTFECGTRAISEVEACRFNRTGPVTKVSARACYRTGDGEMEYRLLVAPNVQIRSIVSSTALSSQEKALPNDILFARSQAIIVQQYNRLKELGLLVSPLTAQ